MLKNIQLFTLLGLMISGNTLHCTPTDDYYLSIDNLITPAFLASTANLAHQSVNQHLPPEATQNISLNFDPVLTPITDSNIILSTQMVISSSVINKEQKWYTCPFADEYTCSYKSKRTNDVHKHSRKHIGEQPYSCNNCDKKFADSSNLKVHQQMHTGKKPFQCDECLKFFTRNSALVIHKAIHLSEKPFTCPVCNKFFRDKRALTIHFRTPLHTQKVFKKNSTEDDIIVQGFIALTQIPENHALQQSLNTIGTLFNDHLGRIENTGIMNVANAPLLNPTIAQPNSIGFYNNATHFLPDVCALQCSPQLTISLTPSVTPVQHNGNDTNTTEIDSAAKRYVCEYCNKSFFGFKNRTQHINNTHFICTNIQCKKAFTSFSDLKEHKKEHAGPYPCTYCDRIFSSELHLNSHLRSHTNEKPHYCTSCNQYFSLLSNFNRHNNKFHSGKQLSLNPSYNTTNPPF